MPSIWPFSRPSSSSSSASFEASSSRIPQDDTPHPHLGNPSTSASASTIPPLIICEGFLSAAQSVVWGNQFRTYLGVGHQQLVDQLPPSPSSSPLVSQERRRRSRRSGLGSDRPVVFAPIGPVSSLHDRACELFYALRGGTVDYGEEHARTHGHGRWGRRYEQGLCPSWGPSGEDGGLPAHFLGHSLGGPTILKLQQLLRQGFFDEALGLPSRSTSSSSGGEGVDEEGEWKAEDLILSITSVSSPFRGTPLVYSLGSEPLPYPKVRMFSFGDMLSKFIHIAAFLDLPFFDAHADAWHFSAKRRKAIKRSALAGGVVAAAEQDPEGAALQGSSRKEEGQEAAGVREFLKQLWKSDWAGGRDCAPWDCTFAERDLDRIEDGWGLDQNPAKRKGRTWYRSYAGGMTVPDPQPSQLASESQLRPAFHRPETYWSLSPLTFTAHLIGHFDYSRLQPSPSFLPQTTEKGGQSKDTAQALASLPPTWWENDGVVPLASQFHPLDCHPDRCRHFSGMPASLPFGKRKKRPQSTDFRLRQPLVLSPVSETATLVDVDAGSCKSSVEVVQRERKKEEEEGGETLLPLPATQARLQGNRSMLGSAKSAAKIAYFTSLRAINLHDPPLVTPSDEELRTFLPDLTPTTDLTASPTDSSPSTPTPESLSDPSKEAQEPTGEMKQELLEPKDNTWYTFQIDNLDHTSLCPFWTGSEVQKQFWTGIGLFLASVDRKAGYTVVETSSAPSQ
ncbi:related to lipase [Ustilago trichophora]|uniref:Related to lipase n=1 Tax=Ustilago trichophora TaxID=86804 RepID=A0A5C3DSV3_9BASI|nr:related to lipase [Ustilago trichophora]